METPFSSIRYLMATRLARFQTSIFCWILIVTAGLLPCNAAESALEKRSKKKSQKPANESTSPKVGEVKLGKKRGFYDRTFELELSTRTQGATIRYTTDGSLPTLERGSKYHAPLIIAGTTVLRIAAFKNGHQPSETKTHTFVFPKDVVRQSPDGLPPEGFPFMWGKNHVDYGMDPRVVDDPRLKGEILAGLKSIPSFSIVADLEDLFGAKRGVYSNPGEQGRESERACSVEMIDPVKNSDFQIDCGIRIRGGFSRLPVNAKHAFRLFFRDEYGSGKLRYPLFGTNGVREFDNLDLRTFQNYSWSLGSDPRATFLRDQFNRDLQLAMGHPAARGDFCHLYINGQYWGMYNTCERPEASFGAAYLGGKKADYDVVKVDSGFTTRQSTYTVIPTDGDLKAWTRLYERASAGLKNNSDYFALQGRNPDGSRNPSLEPLLDVDNLIDYMLIIFWGGNLDAPISAFGDNRNPNNFHSMRRRNGERGFQFFIWDAEHTLLNLDEDRTGPFRTGERIETSSPQWLWQQCTENAEFRVRVGDRIQRHFQKGGVLSPDSLLRRFEARARQIESAVVAESARWGDVKHDFKMDPPKRLGSDGQPLTGPLNRDDDWRREVRRIQTEYLPKRSGIVAGQLFEHGLVPDLTAPLIRRDPGDRGARVELKNVNRMGEIYYTTDGSDPRLVGGGVSPTAVRYSDPVRLPSGRDEIRARIRFEEDWSALVSEIEPTP